MLINISFTDLFDIVKRSLSIIGKRSVDDEGNHLFKDITIGTNEKEIINDFFTNGLSDLVAELSHFISVEYYNNGITSTIYTNYWREEEVTPTAAGMYWYKPSTQVLYKSVEQEVEEETTLVWDEEDKSATTAYVDEQGRHYWWHNSTMEPIGTGVGGSVTLNLTTFTNWNSALEPALITAINNYLSSYALFSWFDITAPKIAGKYATSTTNQLAAIVRLIHEKKATVESTDIISSTSTSTTPTYKLFVQNTSYYKWYSNQTSMTLLTPEQAAALTPEEKAAAIVIPAST